ncbi:hypothetical protein B6N60_02268 [Richelia sinica FACHB-800]|uniref:Uncharacterized protein n=1 Tax=Richelia sinica FACHB-800 TaxID=1357546 RepID=A0A975Y4V6_9NOST|nr:hypothetical protein [Richelia sinica]MBD2665765.1 hypothetical protein [Richelia sinica FACHB-800]QXE23578.1 hypothetical protein B6N60_02268 [Richelia sinica FACHB-800]
MGFLLRIVGLGLLIMGIYLVGQNIMFTTNVSPYWWRGIAADTSVLTLTIGVMILIFFPRGMKNLGWISIGMGMIFVFMSSRAILNPMSLWQFLLSLVLMSAGYKMFASGRLPV